MFDVEACIERVQSSGSKRRKEYDSVGLVAVAVAVVSHFCLMKTIVGVGPGGGRGGA